MIADIQDERGAALAGELGALAAFQHTDVTSEDDVKGAVARAVSSSGGWTACSTMRGFSGR